MINTLGQTDRSLLLWLNGFAGHSKAFDTVVTAIGEWSIYLVPLLLVSGWLYLTYGKNVKNAVEQKVIILQGVISGAFSWLVLNSIIGHFYFRPRPFAGVGGVKEILLHRPDKSFPSDHASFIFGMGFAFYLAGWKKTGVGILGAGVAISLSRVILGVHYPLDILGGLVIGFVGAITIYSLRTWLEKYISRPVIKIASRLKF